MAKAPYMPFFVRDWLTDTELACCSLETQGFWIALLANMWVAPDRGVLQDKSPKQLASMTRCETEEAVRCLAELEGEKVATITRRHGKVTVKSRRMLRDEKERKDAAERQKRKRERERAEASRESHAAVTPKSQRSACASASSESEEGLKRASATSSSRETAREPEDAAADINPGGIAEEIAATFAGAVDGRESGLAGRVQRAIGVNGEWRGLYEALDRWANARPDAARVIAILAGAVEDVQKTCERRRGKERVRNPGGYLYRTMVGRLRDAKILVPWEK